MLSLTRGINRYARAQRPETSGDANNPAHSCVLTSVSVTLDTITTIIKNAEMRSKEREGNKKCVKVSKGRAFWSDLKPVITALSDALTFTKEVRGSKGGFSQASAGCFCIISRRLLS